jgi:hypothetical protein
VVAPGALTLCPLSPPPEVAMTVAAIPTTSTATTAEIVIVSCRLVIEPPPRACLPQSGPTDTAGNGGHATVESTMRRAVFVAAFALMALAGLPIGQGAAGAVAPAAVARVPPGVDPRVFVIGDSVILGAHDALVNRLAGWQVTFIARESFFTWQAPAAITAYHAGVGDISVVALGNNDGEDPGMFANEIDRVMAAFGPVRKVLWVNLRQFRPWVPAANAQLVAATARYPNLEIVDWDARATPDPALVYADGLHLNPGGQGAMAALVGDPVDAAAAQLAAPPTTAPPPPSPPQSSRSSAVAPAVSRTLLGALTPVVLGTVVNARGTPIAPAAVVNGSTAPTVARASESSDAPSTLVLAGCAAAALLGIGVWMNRRSRFADNP